MKLNTDEWTTVDPSPAAECVCCTKALVTIETMMVRNDINALLLHINCVYVCVCMACVDVNLHAAIVRFSYDFRVIDTLIHPK